MAFVSIRLPYWDTCAAYVHIEIHGLLFRRRDDADAQLRIQRCGSAVNMLFDGVHGIAVVRDGGTSGHDFRVMPHQILCMHAGFHIQEICITIQVIKILQQGEVQRAFDVCVRFPLGEPGGQIHRQLFVADGMLQNGFIRGFEQADEFLLLLFLTPDNGQFPANVVVVAMAGKLMQEPVGFKFRAVHQNDAGARIGIHRVLVVWLGIHAVPIQEQAFQTDGLGFKWIHP